MRMKPRMHILLKDSREDGEGQLQHFVQTCLKQRLMVVDSHIFKGLQPSGCSRAGDSELRRGFRVGVM